VLVFGFFFGTPLSMDDGIGPGRACCPWPLAGRSWPWPGMRIVHSLRSKPPQAYRCAGDVRQRIRKNVSIPKGQTAGKTLVTPRHAGGLTAQGRRFFSFDKKATPRREPHLTPCTSGTAKDENTLVVDTFKEPRRAGRCFQRPDMRPGLQGPRWQGKREIFFLFLGAARVWAVIPPATHPPKGYGKVR